jgi:hypothetical protein
MKVLVPVILYLGLVLVLGFALALTAPRTNCESDSADDEN